MERGAERGGAAMDGETEEVAMEGETEEAAMEGETELDRGCV
jgi:hypothetical protein